MSSQATPTLIAPAPPLVRPDSDPELHLREASRYVAFKVGADAFFAFLLLVLTGPLVLIAMILVKATSRGPALYSQTRLGRDGKPFTIWKIRSMVHDCERQSGARWCQPGDARITLVGRWLRKTHIDELPQLWNVLRGEMSLIGPRPERPEFVPQLEKAVPFYRQRLLVRPGVSGFAQIQLPPDTDLESVRLKLAYDLHYLANIGLWFDLKLCWATLLHMLHVPFPVLRWLCGLPRREAVEKAYRDLLAEVPPSPPSSSSRLEETHAT